MKGENCMYSLVPYTVVFTQAAAEAHSYEEVICSDPQVRSRVMKKETRAMVNEEIIKVYS